MSLSEGLCGHVAEQVQVRDRRGRLHLASRDCFINASLKRNSRLRFLPFFLMTLDPSDTEDSNAQVTGIDGLLQSESTTTTVTMTGSTDQQHVEYILLAEFDIDKGASLAHQYPTAPGTDER